MKKLVLVLAVALWITAGVRAAETGGTKVAGSTTERAGANAAVNRTTGVVKGIDATMGTVTLAHEPVPALKWPAMVMPFKISPNLAKGLQVGQKVDVEFESQGMSATITSIAVVK
jgi:Cu(I)/Ag(I) efflux system protein CusF